MKIRIMIVVCYVLLMVGLITGLVMAEPNSAVFVDTSQAGKKDLPVNDPIFSETGIELPNVWQGSTAWGDYDNDGDLDIVLTSGYSTTAVFRNDGNDSFTDINAGLQIVNGGETAWGDYDNDGDLDLLIVGAIFNIPRSKIYRNDGGDMFTDIQAAIIGVWSFPVAEWGDYDNDGDLDFLISGISRSHDSITKIYRNDGDDSFVDSETAAIEAVHMNSLDWGDYDNDDDLDMLWTGWEFDYETTSKIFRNDGYGHFSDINASLENVNQSSVAWGDYDNDGDLDVLLAGWSYSLFEVSRVYRNDGGDVFSDIHAPLVNVARSPSTEWGDYDNDGDLDILLAGCEAWDNDFGFCGHSVTKLYRNDGGDIFVDMGEALPSTWEEPARWGDYDNDGDLDILVTPFGFTTIYKNNITAANTVPSAPSSLHTALVGDSLKLEWDEAEDNETATPGLSYNLRVGTTPGGRQVAAPMALEDGYRQIVKSGSAQLGPSASLKNLVAGTYYWSVQTVDTAFAGSPFAAESSFTLWKAYFPLIPVTE